MGYITNSVGLRLGLSRGWKSKVFLSDGGSVSLFFLQKELVRFLAVFLNRLEFHKRGILFSHAVVRPISHYGLEVDAFLYDPALERHYRKFLNSGYGCGPVTSETSPRDRARIVVLKSLAKPLAEEVRSYFVRLRSEFYSVLEADLVSRLRRTYPGFQFKVRIFPLKARMLSAEFYGRYFLMKFLYRRNLVQVINPIVKRLTRYFSGMRVDCAGRFTRRQRASFSRTTKGSVSLGTLASFADYSQVSLPLKFGVCSIKLWLGQRLASRSHRSESETQILRPFDCLRMSRQRTFPVDMHVRGVKPWNEARRFLTLNSPAVLFEKVMMVRGVRKAVARSTWRRGFHCGSFLSRRVRIAKALLDRAPRCSERGRMYVLRRLFSLRPARSLSAKILYRNLTKSEVARVVPDRKRDARDFSAAWMRLEGQEFRAIKRFVGQTSHKAKRRRLTRLRVIKRRVVRRVPRPRRRLAASVRRNRLVLRSRKTKVIKNG